MTTNLSEGRNQPTAHGRWVLVVTILASSMAFIDGTALNVALNALQRNMHATGAELIWVVNAYLLLLASLILFGGSLSDHLGRNRVFGTGIILFSHCLLPGAGASSASQVGLKPRRASVRLTPLRSPYSGVIALATFPNSC